MGPKVSLGGGTALNLEERDGRRFDWDPSDL